MKKLLCLAAAVSAFVVIPVSAKDDAPRGYMPISELKEAQAKAAKDKRLIVLVVKGADDTCPHCANAVETSHKTAGTGAVEVFARAEALNKADLSQYPAALRNRAKAHFIEGASVTVLVFNSDMTVILAESNRKELDDNKVATAAFHKKVTDAKKELTDTKR